MATTTPTGTTAAVALGLTFGLLTTTSAPASAQTLTRTLVANGLNNPIGVYQPPGDDRLFVNEQSGRIRIIKNGQVLATPFLNADPVTTGSGEQGLLGIAFHPDYQNNQTFFAHYTDNSGTTTVTRFQADPANPDVADPSTAQVILTQSQPFSNHNAGAIHFGPDGYLYIALGDGGSGNDPQCNAQNPGTWLGKMLRIDVDAGSPYSVPADNPFLSTPGYLPEIYHTGLRNPWQWSFDQLTGDLWIGDVGQDAREEVDFAAAGDAGLNFGWKQMEGTLCNSTSNCSSIPPCNSPALVLPVFERNHAGLFSGPCTVVGGYVYRGCAMPALDGTYFSADYCDNRVFSFKYDGSTLTELTERTAELNATGLPDIVAFGQDNMGEVYIVSRGGGSVWKIVAASPVAGADCDANGQIDSCEIAKDASLDLNENNVLDSCENLSLSGDVASISISNGGAQNFSLDAGAANAGALYLLLGSVSGTSPGTPVDAVVLPLNFDFYTSLTLSSPSPPLTNSIGALDAQGQGSASFGVPGGVLSATSVGLELDHAFVLFAANAYFASNPIGVSLDS